jgi:hypothetical protein
MTEIGAGQPFTVSLEAVKLAKGPAESRWERILHHSYDVLILSSSSLGARPPVERVHYYKPSIHPDEVLLVHDLLSDTMLVCDDYAGQDSLYLEL